MKDPPKSVHAQGVDAQRIQEEIDGAIRPERGETLASDLLWEAVEALHSAGDPAVLYRYARAFPASMASRAKKQHEEARRIRLRHARRAVLNAAFAGEAYVNEFLAAHGVLDEWDREPTTRKFLKGTEAAYGSKLVIADREAYPVLVNLYKLRDKLAHPKPGFGLNGPTNPASADYADLFLLPKVAEYLVMVAGTADTLIPRAYGWDKVDPVARAIWFGREKIRDYAKRNRKLPKWDADSERDLFRQAGDRAIEIVRTTSYRHGI